MEVEFEEIAVEQRPGGKERPLAELTPERQPALPASSPDQPQPRGRPWLKGQSGNPAGRPPRIHPPAAVAEYVIGRKTIPVAKKVRDLLLAGDRTMLKLWYQNVALARGGRSGGEHDTGVGPPAETRRRDRHSGAGGPGSGPVHARGGALHAGGAR